MTRFLSEALQAPEPSFRQGLQRLEQTHGHPSHDIRLTTALQRQAQAKLVELGLDPHDTTPQELYHVLTERVKLADTELVKNLRTRSATHISAEADVVAGMVHALQEASQTTQCFALKATALRALLVKSPPKKAMKQLGYRSVASFLKHESMALALAAAWLSENHVWQQSFTEHYKKLKTRDFELRKVSILHPDSKRWQVLAAGAVNARKQNLMSFRELGALILLPLPKAVPSGTVTASLSLALHELNELSASSTYLKLSQVRPDFGEHVYIVATEEPHVSSGTLDRTVPWQLIQRYYARFSERIQDAAFEPHVLPEDMTWRSVERYLSSLAPSFSVWHDTAHVGLLQNHEVVSFNIVDAALNVCNNLPFEKRIAESFRQSLLHELLLQYLSHDAVEQTVLDQLEPQLAVEAVIA